MPELPEVETVVRDLRPFLAGRRITTVTQITEKALRKPWHTDWNDLLAGPTLCGVRRRGKWIVLDLEGASHLVFHLGMSGQLTVVPASQPLASHTHMVFDLSSEKKNEPERRQLRFRDIRRFGSATFFRNDVDLDAFFVAAKLGPEPFDLGAGYWRQRLAATNRCLKAVLLDQSVVAGVGNIYADEALYESRLHPARRAHHLDARAASRLRKAITTVLNRAIDRRGSSIRNYVGGSGLQGGYQKEFRVYGRTNEPCPRCGSPIACIRLAGRSTHFCPQCQQEKEARMLSDKHR